MSDTREELAEAEDARAVPPASFPPLTPAAPAASTPPSFGRVEHYQAETGIAGWLSPVAGSTVPGTVELVARGQVIATATANVFRPDLHDRLPPEARVEPWIGFQFTPAAMVAAASLPATHRHSPLQVRDARTGEILPGPLLPTGEEVAATAGDFAKSGPKSGGAAPNPTSARELLAMLETLRTDANYLLREPLIPNKQSLQGSIEIVIRVDAGLFVVGGWLPGELPEYSAALLLIDGRKVPASLFATCYERADLVPGASAFCALMKVDAPVWRADQPFVLALGEGNKFMRTRRGLTLLPIATGQVWLANAVKIADDRKQLIVDAMTAQAPAAATASSFGCVSHVESLHVFPGFGALVRGWVLSPTAELQTVSTRVGDASATARQDTIATMSRPDLSTGSPLLGDRVRHAGYAALCVGPIEIIDEHPTIRLRMADGAEFDVPVARERTRVGYTATSFETLAAEFPAYASEAFFPAFSDACAAAIRSVRPRLSHMRPLSSRHMLIFAMPVPRSDARLALTEVARHTRDWDDAGITILFGMDHDRTAVMNAVADTFGDAPIGLVRHDSRTDVTDVLAAVLRDCRAETFTFVQEGYRLTSLGWATARASAGGGDLHLYRPAHERSGQASDRHEFGAVTWTAEAFRDHAVRAVPSVGSGLLGRGLSLRPDAIGVEDGVSRYHAMRTSAVVRRFGAAMETRLLALQGVNR